MNYIKIALITALLAYGFPLFSMDGDHLHDGGSQRKPPSKPTCWENVERAMKDKNLTRVEAHEFSESGADVLLGRKFRQTYEQEIVTLSDQIKNKTDASLTEIEHAIASLYLLHICKGRTFDHKKVDAFLKNHAARLEKDIQTALESNDRAIVEEGIKAFGLMQLHCRQKEYLDAYKSKLERHWKKVTRASSHSNQAPSDTRASQDTALATKKEASKPDSVAEKDSKSEPTDQRPAVSRWFEQTVIPGLLSKSLTMEIVGYIFLAKVDLAAYRDFCQNNKESILAYAIATAPAENASAAEIEHARTSLVLLKYCWINAYSKVDSAEILSRIEQPLQILTSRLKKKSAPIGAPGIPIPETSPRVSPRPIDNTPPPQSWSIESLFSKKNMLILACGCAVTALFVVGALWYKRKRLQQPEIAST